MIDERGPVRVIMNDNPGNAPGDFACVRVKVGVISGGVAHVGEEGWELIGFGFVVQCMRVPSYVDLVYRFGHRPGGAP